MRQGVSNAGGARRDTLQARHIRLALDVDLLDFGNQGDSPRNGRMQSEVLSRCSHD